MLTKITPFVYVCAFLVTPIFGGSIFDDPLPPQPPSTPAQSAAPAETPNPPPATPPPHYTAQPVSIVAPTTRPVSGPDALLNLSAATHESVDRAQELSKEYLQMARIDVQVELEKNLRYAMTKRELQTASDRLDNERLVGSIEDRMQASTEYNRLAAELKRMQDQAFSTNEAYLDAESLYAEVNPPATPAIPAASPSQDNSQRAAIVAAIGRHDFVPGMTYDQACKSAQTQGTLFSSENNVMVYHWNVVAQVGSRRVVTESHTSITTGAVDNTYSDVPDYRIVGYVEATFVDGKMTTFNRVSER
jgi:hypothetical protein